MKKTRLHDEIPADEDENFLSRWSRRKQQSRDSGAVAGIISDDQPDVKLGDELERARDDINRDDIKALSQLTDEDMPPLESLTENSDYSCFFAPNVSEALRKKALRILFSSPQFNICDGLDDYDEDYTCFEKMGDIITADVRHQMDRLAAMQTETLEKSPALAPENAVAATPVDHDRTVQNESSPDTAPTLEPDGTEKS